MPRRTPGPELGADAADPVATLIIAAAVNEGCKPGQHDELQAIPGALAAYLPAHRTMINGSALCAALAVTKRD
jgi:hypothetical protein